MNRATSPVGAIASVLVALMASACAGGPKLPGLPVAGGAADASMLTVGSLPGEVSHLQLSSSEVYARIARGANACWFGPRGRHGKTHILHADAVPSMNGGAVEVIVHERANDQPKPWGYKAFRVALAESAGLDGTPGSGGTSITVENARMPDAEAQRMRAEVFQWAAGNEGCKADPALDKPAETASAAQPLPAAKSSPGKAAPKAAAKQ